MSRAHYGDLPWASEFDVSKHHSKGHMPQAHMVVSRVKYMFNSVSQTLGLDQLAAYAVTSTKTVIWGYAKRSTLGVYTGCQ